MTLVFTDTADFIKFCTRKHLFAIQDCRAVAGGIVFVDCVGRASEIERRAEQFNGRVVPS